MLDARAYGSERASADLRQPAMHVCYIYNDVLERAALLARFYEAGESANQKLICVTDDSAALRGELVAAGAHPDDSRWSFVKPADLGLGTSDFSIKRAFERFRSFNEAVVQEGYSGVRAASDMNWILRLRETAESPIEFEAEANVLLKTQPTASLCYYDARKFGGSTLFDALCVHPYIFVGQQIVYNPYFIEPEAFLERYRARPPA
jgi:hypothetical protein